MKENQPAQLEIRFQTEQEELEQMDPLQQQVVELFDRFQDLNWGFQNKVAGKVSQGTAKDWRAQREIEGLFLRKEFLNKISDNPTRHPRPRPKPDDFLGEHSIQNRLRLFMQVMEAKLDQMNGNTLFAERRYPTVRAWCKSPRTIMKTIQEALSDPTDYIIFEREEIIQPDDLRRAMENIILSPERINDTLLLNLGLHKYSSRPTEKSPRITTAERLARSIEAIPEIRRMLLSLDFIRRPDEKADPVSELKYFRMMRIGEGNDPGNPNPYAGYILGTQISNGHRTLFRTDVHSADRRLLHIDSGYKEELEKLHTILETLNSIERNTGTWSGDENTAKREELNSALLEIVESLKHASNYHKKRLRENITNYLLMAGEGNHGASKWALNHARINIGKRLHEMERISRELKVDEQKVKGLILEQEAPYAKFLRDIEALKDEFSDTSRVRSESVRPKLEKLRAHITSTMTLEPYLQIGRECLVAIEQTLAELDDKAISAGSESFMRVYSMTKLERAYHRLTRANRDLVERGEDEADPRAVLQRITQIYDELRTHSLAPHERHDSLREPYIRFYEKLREIMFILGDLLGVSQAEIPQYRNSEQTIESVKPDPMPEPIAKSDEPKKEWRMRLSSILENQTDRIKSFLKKAWNKARAIVRHPKKHSQEATADTLLHPNLPFPSPPKTYTHEEKYEALVNVRKIMSDFSFTELFS